MPPFNAITDETALTHAQAVSQVIENWETPVTTFEGFEDNDIAEYGGDTGAFSVVTSPVHEGGYALEANGGSSNSLIADTGTTFSPPVAFRWHQYVPANSHISGFAFGLQNENGFANNSGYFAAISDSQGEIELWRLNDGSPTNLNANGVNVSTDTYLTCQLYWASDGTIEFGIGNNTTDGPVVTATDTNYTSGGYGWFSYEQHYVDGLRDTHPLLDWHVSAHDGTVTGTAYEGSQAILLSASDGGPTNTIQSFNLSRQIQRGDRIEALHQYPDTASGAELSWAGGEYTARYNPGDGQLELIKDSTSGTDTQTNITTPSTGTWYSFNVDFDSAGDGTISVTYRNTETDSDLASTSFTESTKTADSGAVSCRAGAPDDGGQGADADNVLWDVIRTR